MQASSSIRRRGPGCTTLTTSVLAIDPQTGWVRIWNEWVILDRSTAGASPFDPADVQRIGAAWLIRQLIGLPLLAGQSFSDRRILAARRMKARTPAPCELTSLTE